MKIMITRTGQGYMNITRASGQFDPATKLEDPFGHVWWVATHKEDVAPDELQKRVQAMFGGKK